MNYFDVIQTRQSVRAYAWTPVEEEKLQQILEAANRAPSAGNLQAYEIYVVKQASRRTALARAALNQEFIAAAPVVLVFCAYPARSVERYGQRGVKLYSVQDATIACAFAMLAATALGLGSVWVGAFDEDSVRQAISAPGGVLPIAILPIGYPAEEPRARSRRPLSNLVHEA